MFSLYFIALEGEKEWIYSGILVFVYIALTMFLLSSLRTAKALMPYAIYGIIVDIFFLASLSFILYQVMDPSKTPFSFILKSDIYPLTILFLIFHFVSFKKLVVVLSGVFLFLFNLSLLLISYALADYKSTTSIEETFTSYAINIDFELGKLIIFLFIIFSLYYLSKRIHDTILESAKAEVATVQLERYFSPDISQKILRDALIRPGGSEQEIAILFSDITNFTSISEQMQPQEVLTFLSHYHAKMIDAIFEHKGSLDKFIGDAIMATFGLLSPSDHDADNAIHAALAMNKALDDLNKERLEQGLFAIEHRVGIHYGKVLVGNIGSTKRLEFTVIGDAVNTANRIEQLCKEYKVALLISKEVVDKITYRFNVQKLGDTSIRGRKQGIELFTILS